jgi:hypothetical protein
MENCTTYFSTVASIDYHRLQYGIFYILRLAQISDKAMGMMFFASAFLAA